MKYVAWIVTIAAVIYIWSDRQYISEQLASGFNVFVGTIDAESLKDRPLEPFALPKGHCKASFPGTPHPRFGHELLSSILYQGTCYGMADKEVTYYLSETVMPMKVETFAGVKKTMWIVTTANSNLLNRDPARPTGNNESISNVPVDQTDEFRTQQAIDDAADEWIKENKATVTARVPVAILGGRYNGREICGYLKNPKDGFRLRFFADYKGQRIVAIGLIGKTERLKIPSTNKFLQSLEMWQ